MNQHGQNGLQLCQTIQHLLPKKEIWVCATHFEGEWITIQGGRRPLNPPSIFPGVPKSCTQERTVDKIFIS